MPLLVLSSRLLLRRPPTGGMVSSEPLLLHRGEISPYRDLSKVIGRDVLRGVEAERRWGMRILIR